MSNLNLSLDDYKNNSKLGLFSPPNNFCPYYEIAPVLYRKYESEYDGKGKGNLSKAFVELRRRINTNYFREVYPLQTNTLTYSERTFPAYRFILPHVIASDWLAMVGWNKFQRDHLLHQPLCGYIALKLLDNDRTRNPLAFSNGKTLIDLCVEKILQWDETFYIREFLIDCGIKKNDILLNSQNPVAQNVWRAFFREAAYVAAIYHDLGYPWQYAESMQKNLNRTNSPAKIHNTSAEQIVESFKHRLLFYPLNGYKKIDVACPSDWHKKLIDLVDDASTNTHGFPGALNFLDLNDCIRRYPPTMQNPFQLLCVEWAAAAIMMHDMSKIYWGKSVDDSKIPENPFLRLSFNKDPLSSLIALVDFMQEFGRPSAKHKPDYDSVEVEYETARGSTELKIDKSILSILFKIENPAIRAIKQKELTKDKYKYFSSQYGYIDLSSIGISEVNLAASKL